MFACLYSSSSSQAKLLALASSFSPLVEDSAPGVVIFSIVGLGRMIGTPQEIAAVIARRGAEAGIQANLAISADPGTAELAARNIRGLTLIPPGKEADRLGGLPVEALAMFLQTPDILEALHRWGIKTLGEMIELPELGFVARFGEEGAQLMRLARGEARRPLRAIAPPENYERCLELDHPQSLLEPLSFVMSSMLSELMGALERQGLATNRITLGLKLVNRTGHRRTLEFPVPVRDSKVILKQLQFDLEAHPPKAAVLGVCMKLSPVEPRALQHGLFIPQAPVPEKLQLTLARLTALAGEGNVGSPYLLDTHRRDAFRMRTFSPEDKGERCPQWQSADRKNGDSQSISLFTSSPIRNDVNDKWETVPMFSRYAFRYYRPPVAAQVRVQETPRVHTIQPVFVMACSAYGELAKGEVLMVAGPWRASGDWWSESSWARDEWDIELSNGGVYRLFRRLFNRMSEPEKHVDPRNEARQPSGNAFMGTGEMAMQNPDQAPLASGWFLEGMYD
jgi:protein ImuB